MYINQNNCAYNNKPSILLLIQYVNVEQNSQEKGDCLELAFQTCLWINDDATRLRLSPCANITVS